MPTDKIKYIWGIYDGRGNDINLTFSDYYKYFIFDHDFTTAPQTSQNKLIGTGNTLSNISEFFPNSQFVEYHFPGTQANDLMNWSSLRLVFQEYNIAWYLVAIIHDQWTIWKKFSS